MCGDPVITSYFKVPAAAMVRHLAGRWVRVWGVAVALVPLGLLAAAAVSRDLRWALVALIVMMVVIPMVMTIVYFAYALRPEVARATIPHRLVIRHGESVTRQYRPDEERRVPRDEVIPWDRIALLRDCGTYWLLIIKPE